MVESSSSAARRVAISGASGFIGSALGESLRRDGFEVHALRRGAASHPGDIAWNPVAGRIDGAALEGMDAIVNLAGEPLDHRWTTERKRRIRESRVGGTSLLANTLASLERPPRVLLNASAVGYYGDRGDEVLDENSRVGDDWLARLTAEWERAAQPVTAAGTRLVLLRTGLVLDPHGGVLKRLLPIFKAGLGGPLGGGAQWVSWITRDDEVGAIRFLIDAERVAGPVNLVAPRAVRNAELARTLGRVLQRPALIPAPAFALELAFGEMGRQTILVSQRVEPRVLLGAGFAFGHETLEGALRSVLGR